MTDAPHLQSVTLQLPASLPEPNLFNVAALMEEAATSVSWEKNKSGWEIQWVFPAPAPVKQLARDIKALIKTVKESDLTCVDVPDINWLEESYRQFPPFKVGPFFIFGSHYDGKTPKDFIPLQIDAATAFGSGEHGTTRGCLEALAKLKEDGFRPKNILDMGAGSGILAIAAYKLWKKPTLAIDIDREATRMACHHRKINRVSSDEKGMRCATGDGFAAPQVGMCKGPSFDLIIANILAGPLVDMATQLAACLKPSGKVVLSGLLIEQESAILSAYRACGLGTPRRITHGEWRTLTLTKI